MARPIRLTVGELTDRDLGRVIRLSRPTWQHGVGDVVSGRLVTLLPRVSLIDGMYQDGLVVVLAVDDVRSGPERVGPFAPDHAVELIG